MSARLTQSTPTSEAVKHWFRLDPDVPRLSPQSNILLDVPIVSGVGKIERWSPSAGTVS